MIKRCDISSAKILVRRAHRETRETKRRDLRKVILIAAEEGRGLIHASLP